MTFLERWFEEVWNKGREDAIDEMTSVDTKGHGLKGPDGKEVDGIVAFKSFYRIFRAAFSDIHVEMEETVTEGDRMVARCLVTGTHTGDSLGRPSTGKPVTFRGMTMVRLKDGKIVES